MDDLPSAITSDELQEVASQYGIRVLNPGRWERKDLETVLEAVKDLAALLGGPIGFKGELRRVLSIYKLPRKTRFAAVALPVIGVVYFESASWSNESELKWQTVHELGHIWDMRQRFGLSTGLKRATGSRYRGLARQFPIPRKYEPRGKWLPGRGAPLNALEDWADSVATYVYSDYAQSLSDPKLISTIRWNYISAHMRVNLPYPTDWDSRFDEAERCRATEVRVSVS